MWRLGPGDDALLLLVRVLGARHLFNLDLRPWHGVLRAGQMLRGMRRDRALQRQAPAVFLAIKKLDRELWETPGNTLTAIEAMAPYLSSLEIQEALETAHTLEPKFRDGAVAALIARLATFGPSEAREAIRIAETNE